MRFAPVATLILLFPVACGAPLKTQKQADLVQQLRVDDAFADDYFVDDLACQAGAAGADAIGPSQVFQWQGDGVRPTQFAFSNTNASASLSSHAVAQSFY